jgi:hypothetical protein
VVGKALEIFDAPSLRQTVDCLRDAEFDGSMVEYDTHSQRLTIRLWRPDESPARGEKIIRKRRWILILNSVVNYQVAEKDCPYKATHSLGDIEWDNRGELRLFTYDGIVITITVRELHGQLLATNGEPL